MATETSSTITVNLATGLTDGVYTSSALTLASDYLGLQISWTGVTAGYPTIYVKISNDDTTYVDVTRPVENYELPIKLVILEEEGSDSMIVNGLDVGYAKVIVSAPNATVGTITIKANY